MAPFRTTENLVGGAMFQHSDAAVKEEVKLLKSIISGQCVQIFDGVYFSLSDPNRY